MNRLSLSGQSVDPNPRDILLFTSTSKLNLRGRQKQHQGALPRTISGSRGACLRFGQMGHYAIECTAKILLIIFLSLADTWLGEQTSDYLNLGVN